MHLRQLDRHCPVCGTSTGEVLHTQRFVLSEGHPLPDRYDVVACTACGFCFADTALSQAAYDAYYARLSKYADSTTSTGAGLAPWDADRLEQMAGQVAAFAPDRTARILDIGCANGGLLAALQRHGYSRVCGIDPAPACVAQAGRLAPGRVWTGTLAALPAGIGQFDGILLSHVMEHVRDLQPAMGRVRGLLQPGGWVYLEVPDATRYAEFLVAPFQDFNTEHINHFSAISLANLCRCCGFEPAAGGTKNIFSAKDIPYPAVFWFARLANDPLPLEKDEQLRPALEAYIRASRALMQQLDARIGQVLAAHPAVIVWGTGQLTLKLLEETCLRTARIEAFVDGNPVNHGRILCGQKIVSGHDLVSSTTPILVCSLINVAAIRETIRTLGLTNPVVTLSKSTS